MKPAWGQIRLEGARRPNAVAAPGMKGRVTRKSLHRVSRGLTLVETMVYAFLSLLILLMVFAIFERGRTSYNTVTDTYLLGKEAAAGLRSLRSDLEETALASITLHDRPDGDTTLSMVSARNSTTNQFETTFHGAPKWQKHVFYTVTGDDSNGALIRWEQPMAQVTTPLPSATTVDADAPQGSSASSRRPLFHGLYRPPQGEVAGALPVRLRARFVRYQTTAGTGVGRQIQPCYTLSNPYSLDLEELPAELANSQSVPLLYLLLTVGSNSQGNQTRFIQLPLYVHPRY